MFLISVLSRMLGRFSWWLKRVVSIVIYEGLTGAFDRVRYPKAFVRHRPPPAPSGPVLIIGGDSEARDHVSQAILRAGLTVATSGKDGHNERVILNPDIGDLDSMCGKDLVVLFEQEDPDPLYLHLIIDKCGAVLCDNISTLGKLQKLGLPFERAFAFKNRGTLREGMSRYLLSARSIHLDEYEWTEIPDLLDLPRSPRLCLSLPEAVERRGRFNSSYPDKFKIVDGLRCDPGWVGAAASYRAIAQACLVQQVAPVLICEDDVDLPSDFDERIESILSYLEERQWDVFSGLLTDAGPDYVVTRIDYYGDNTFIHLNRCVGLVCGNYNTVALNRIATWSEETRLPIDRYLENSDGLRVVTTLPFLADHCDDLTSTVWRFRNRRYRNVIRRSEARLAQLVQDYERRVLHG